MRARSFFFLGIHLGKFQKIIINPPGVGGLAQQASTLLSWVWVQHCCECGWAGVDLWIGGLFVGTWQQRGSVGAEGGGGAQAARGDGGLQQHLGVDTPLFTIVIK